MNGTEQAFRLIVLRWPNPQPNLFAADRYGYHAVATNRQEAASRVIWKHNQRGESENWHKELKVGFGMEQMPCGQFEANAVYFAIGVLAYNLAQLLKRQVLPAAYRTATVATLRWKVYRLAGKLVHHARGWILQIKADLESSKPAAATNPTSTLPSVNPTDSAKLQELKQAIQAEQQATRPPVDIIGCVPSKRG